MWKEQNIFFKLLLTDFDFLFFNDDHYLLQPFSPETYHYSGKLSQSQLRNSFSATINSTIDVFGDIPNYFRHAPIYVERKVLACIFGTVTGKRGVGFALSLPDAD